MCAFILRLYILTVIRSLQARSIDYPEGYKGCYNDGKYNYLRLSYDRVLPERLEDSDLNNAAKCKDECKDMGYRYAGTESGEECFCGNEINHNPKKLPDTDCNHKCPGQEEENCGGHFSISIYDTIETTQNLTKPTTITAKESKDVSDKTSSPFPLSKKATEVSDHIKSQVNHSTGNTISSTNAATTQRRTPATVEIATNVSDQNESQFNHSRTSTISSTYGATTQNRTTPTTAGTARDEHHPVGYIGCYKDDKGSLLVSDRVLSTQLGGLSSNNAAQCMKECLKQEYKYAGTESGNECFCGNEINHNPEKLPDTDCNSKCPGQEEENCGGHWRISIYETFVTSKNKTANTTVTIETTEGVPDSTTLHFTLSTIDPVSSTGKARDKNHPAGYIGCYKSDKGSVFSYRGLPRMKYDTFSNCAAQCKEECKALGYKYAGTEVGKECFCGSEINTSEKVPDSDCYYKCPGQEGENCGGHLRISIYDTFVETQNLTIPGTATVETATGVTNQTTSHLKLKATDTVSSTYNTANTKSGKPKVSLVVIYVLVPAGFIAVLAAVGVVILRKRRGKRISLIPDVSYHAAGSTPDIFGNEAETCLTLENISKQPVSGTVSERRDYGQTKTNYSFLSLKSSNKSEPHEYNSRIAGQDTM